MAVRVNGGGEGEGEANPNERCIFIIFGIPWHCKLTEELSNSWAGELSSTRALRTLAARQMGSYISLPGSRVTTMTNLRQRCVHTIYRINQKGYDVVSTQLGLDD